MRGAIADAAATIGADLIVMGSRGRSRLAGIVLGSVTASVITVLPAPSLWPGSTAPRPSLATNASSGPEPPADAAMAPQAPTPTLSGAREGSLAPAGLVAGTGRTGGVLHRGVGACQTGPLAPEVSPSCLPRLRSGF